MLCQNCNENEANIKYTQIINGVKKQMNLCEKCANKLGVNEISFNMPIDFSNFLEDFWEEDNVFLPKFEEKQKSICEKCNMKYEDFIKNGKFGCDECYNTFSQKIDPLLKNIQGVNQHIGRKGNSSKNYQSFQSTNNSEENSQKLSKKEKDKNLELEHLRERLKKEIAEERYEEAAKTRDEIKKIEN